MGGERKIRAGEDVEKVRDDHENDNNDVEDQMVEIEEKCDTLMKIMERMIKESKEIGTNLSKETRDEVSRLDWI